jgi:hypothetical protein
MKRPDGWLLFVILGLVAIGCGASGSDDDDAGDDDTDDDDVPEYHYQPEAGPYDYLIVTAVDAAAVDEFAGFKQSRGMSVIVKALADVDRTGFPDVEAAVRGYLQSEYDPSRVQNVLLVGSHDSLPMRYFFLNASGNLGDEYTVPTDYYYGEMDIDWDADGDGDYGEWGAGQDVDDETWNASTPWKKDLRVGRIPWDDEDAVRTILSRTIDYERIPRADGNLTTLLIGGRIMFEGDGPALMEIIKARIDVDPFAGNIFTMYGPDAAGIEHDFDLSHQNLLSTWEEIQPGFVMWASHGSWDGAYTSATGGPFIENDDTTTLRGVAPCVVFSTGCTNAEPEYEALGFRALRDFAVAFIGSTRITHPGDYGEGAIATFPPGVAFVLVDNLPLGKAVDDAVDTYMTKLYPKYYGPILYLRNIFGFSILGDPSLTYRGE